MLFSEQLLYRKDTIVIYSMKSTKFTLKSLLAWILPLLKAITGKLHPGFECTDDSIILYVPEVVKSILHCPVA